LLRQWRWILAWQWRWIWLWQWWWFLAVAAVSGCGGGGALWLGAVGSWGENRRETGRAVVPDLVGVGG